MSDADDTMLVFGYGSLMNPTSLAKTSPAAEIIGRVTLSGYQRKANAMHEAYPEVALNIIPSVGREVVGVLIRLPLTGLPALQQREIGYAMLDVSEQIAPRPDEPVVTFVAPNVADYGHKKIHQEYLDVCLGGVPEDERAQWLADTIIECEITDAPRQQVYRHS